MISMKPEEVKAALSALAEIDDDSNKMPDTNSMIAASDNYLTKAAEGTSGVPINYDLKDITKSMLAEVWVARYFPGSTCRTNTTTASPILPHRETHLLE